MSKRKILKTNIVSPIFISKKSDLYEDLLCVDIKKLLDLVNSKKSIDNTIKEMNKILKFDYTKVINDKVSKLKKSSYKHIPTDVLKRSIIFKIIDIFIDKILYTCLNSGSIEKSDFLKDVDYIKLLYFLKENSK